MLVSGLEIYLQAPWKKSFGKSGNPCVTGDWANETGAESCLVMQPFWLYVNLVLLQSNWLQLLSVLQFCSSGNQLCYLPNESIVRYSPHTKQFGLISQMATRGTERWSDSSKVMSQIMANLVIKQRFRQSCVSALHCLVLCASVRTNIAHCKTCISFHIASWGSTAARQPHLRIHLGTDLGRSFCFSIWVLAATSFSSFFTLCCRNLNAFWNCSKRATVF